MSELKMTPQRVSFAGMKDSYFKETVLEHLKQHEKTCELCRKIRTLYKDASEEDENA